MLPQLLLSKRLFGEGANFARRSDAVSCGLAVSLFQDAVELFIWALIKDRNISVKDTSSFVANIEAIERAGIILADRAKIQELNKARVGFKHYGNLPAPGEAVKFETYTEDFLRQGLQDHFGQAFESISLVDLVSDAEVRVRLKAAEALIVEAEFKNAAREIAISKTILFRNLERHIPEVDRNLGSFDGLLERATNTRGFGGFKYIAGYLGLLREISVITLLRIPLPDYTFIRTYLPTANRFGDGNWQTVDNRLRDYEEQECRRSIGILVDISVRLDGVA